MLIEKIGSGFDFNTIGGDEDKLYIIGNLKNQTLNAPVETNAACMYFKIKRSNYQADLLIGIDEPLMYGRYTYSSTLGTWIKLL